MQFHWSSRANWSPGKWSLDLGVWAEGKLVGTQGIGAENFAVLRTVSTGSWLTRDLVRRGASIIVWPEKIAVLSSPWRNQVLASLQRLADETRATIIAGFDDRTGERRPRPTEGEDDPESIGEKRPNRPLPPE